MYNIKLLLNQAVNEYTLRLPLLSDDNVTRLLYKIANKYWK